MPLRQGMTEGQLEEIEVLRTTDVEEMKLCVLLVSLKLMQGVAYHETFRIVDRIFRIENDIVKKEIRIYQLNH